MNEKRDIDVRHLGRREPRRFVPPPWEARPHEGKEQPESRRTVDSVESEGGPAGTGMSDQADRPGRGVRPDKSNDAPVIDAMLLQLQMEEPPAVGDTRKAALAVSAGIGVVGLILVVWGAVAMARTAEAGFAGVLGSGIVLATGASLMALGVWFVGRSLKQQRER